MRPNIKSEEMKSQTPHEGDLDMPQQKVCILLNKMKAEKISQHNLMGRFKRLPEPRWKPWAKTTKRNKWKEVKWKLGRLQRNAEKTTWIISHFLVSWSRATEENLEVGGSSPSTVSGRKGELDHYREAEWLVLSPEDILPGVTNTHSRLCRTPWAWFFHRPLLLYDFTEAKSQAEYYFCHWDYTSEWINICKVNPYNDNKQEAKIKIRSIPSSLFLSLEGYPTRRKPRKAAFPQEGENQGCPSTSH